MIQKMEVLSSTKHQDLRLAKINSFEFAQKISLVGLSVSEMAQASMFYPIVFPEQGEAGPLAILSYVKDTNAFVDEKGNWKVPYVPAYFRFYPFVIAKTDKENETKDQEEVALCIDRDAPHFEPGMGDPLFNADGKPVDFVLNVFEVLKKHRQELKITKEIFNKVAENGVLQSKELSIQMDNGEKIKQKFKVVDMEKVKQLDDKVLAEWARTGVMAFIYDHVRSLAKLGTQQKSGKVTLS